MQVTYPQSSSVITPQDIFNLSAQNNSLFNLPLTVVGDASDLIPSSSFVYTNTLNIHDLTTDSPSNSENSTFGAFFMSEMEKITTVKATTELYTE